VRFEGDRFREVERWRAAPARGGTEGVVRCFACSSAMRASMAPRMRCDVPVSLKGRGPAGKTLYLQALEHGCGFSSGKKE
jgi:hypothetical protein